MRRFGSVSFPTMKRIKTLLLSEDKVKVTVRVVLRETRRLALELGLTLTFIKFTPLSGPVKSVFYIPNFITEEEERFLQKNIEDKELNPRWRQMKGRRLQNWGPLCFHHLFSLRFALSFSLSTAQCYSHPTLTLALGLLLIFL